MAITFIGALVALVPVMVYEATKSEALLVLVFGVGAVATIVLTKLTEVTYVQCRLALVSYILTVYTFHDASYAEMGLTCYGYCLMWIVSTALGVVLSVACIAVWDLVRGAFVKKG